MARCCQGTGVLLATCHSMLTSKELVTKELVVTKESVTSAFEQRVESVEH